MASIDSVAKDLQKPNQIVPGDRLKQLVARIDVKKRFEEILGANAAAFISSLIAVVQGSKELQLCDSNAILACGAMAATLKLPIDKNLGFAAIIPYREKGVLVPQFQIMTKGFVQLGQNTGRYQTMNNSEIYEDELESWNPITGEFKITPMDTWKFRDDGKVDKIIGYAAYIKTKHGFEKFLYMSNRQIEAHGKRYSKSFFSEKGKWQLDRPSMSLKTVLKLLISKWGPLSTDPDMQRALAYDQASAKGLSLDKDNAIDAISYPDNLESQEKHPGEMSEAELKAVEAKANADKGTAVEP